MTRRRPGRSLHRLVLRAIPIVVLASVALLASGCLGSSFAYVSHRSPDGSVLYFKVPTDWKVYDTKQVLSVQNGPLGPSEVKQLANGAWLEAASAGPKPSARAALSPGRRWPTAEMVVRPLTPTQQDTLSYQTMREAFLGADPLASNSGYQVLSYSPFASTDGVRGVRLVADIPKLTPTRTFGEIVESDRQGSFEFALEISCQVSCWGLNSQTIKQVLGSWTVKQAP